MSATHTYYAQEITSHGKKESSTTTHSFTSIKRRDAWVAVKAKPIKDKISLRDDVFKNPDAKLDVVATVIHEPDSEKPIVEEWKCPYHNGRMCMEIIKRGL